MAKEIINLSKNLEKIVHSPRIDDRPVYPRLSYEDMNITEKWFQTVQKKMLSPSLIKEIDIATPSTGVKRHYVTPSFTVTNKPQLPPASNITLDNLQERTMKLELATSTNLTSKSILKNRRTIQEVLSAVMTGELKVVGNPFSILSKPFYIPNIEEFYFSELVFCSEEILAILGANSIQDLPRIIGLFSTANGRQTMINILAQSNTETGTAEEFFQRYPRLKAFGFIQGDRHQIIQGSLLEFVNKVPVTSKKIIVNGVGVCNKALVALPEFQQAVQSLKIPTCLVYSDKRELSTKFITHSRIYYLDKVFLKDYFDKKSEALTKLLTSSNQEEPDVNEEEVENSNDLVFDELEDISEDDYEDYEDYDENPTQSSVSKESSFILEGEELDELEDTVLKEEESSLYSEEMHGAFKDMISKLLVDAWEDLYGKYLAGLEDISGLIVPSGVITSPKGDNIKHQCMLSVRSSGAYTKEFPFANAIYEEFIRAMQKTGIPVVKTPSDDRMRTTPYQYNPKLQKSIVSGAIDEGAYQGGWSAYKKSLAKFVEPLAQKLAIKKEETGSDDEIYNIISAYLISIIVINYRPGMGFQLRISCGKPALSKKFADNLRICLMQREASESHSMFMGKARFSEVFVSESGGSVELTCYLNMVAYQAVPDLLGELLVNLENGKFKPSVDNIMLGRKLDNSIAFLNLKASGWLVPIIAGSRSGKGVQTLNILANIITLQLCLFYLDNKPDMVVQLWELAKQVGIKDPVAIDGLKVSGKTEVDSKDFVAPYQQVFTASKKQMGAHPILNEHLSTMVYLKTLLLIRLAFLYNRSIMGGKYGDIFVVADEIYKLSEKVKGIYADVSLKENEIKAKEKVVKDKEPLNKKKQELNKIISWMENLWSEYNSAGIGEFNLGIHFLSLSQFDAIDRYTGAGTGASFKQFMTTFAMKGFGTARIYGRRQESLTKTQYGLETYEKGTGSSKEDIDLIQSYRHFTLTDGDNKLLHHRIYKPLLVINENDSKEYKQMTQGGGDGKDGAFVATMINSMKKAGVSEAQIQAFRQRVLQNPEIAGSIGFQGVLEQMARLTGTDYQANLKESLRKAIELSKETLVYFGVISEDTGIHSVYEYLCSTKIEHLWTYSQIKNCKEKGLPLSSLDNEDDEVPSGDGGETYESIFGNSPEGVELPQGNSTNTKTRPSEQFAAFQNTNQSNNAAFTGGDSFGDGYGEVQSYTEQVFSEEDELLRDYESNQNIYSEEPSQEVDYVSDDSELNLNTDDLYASLLSRASINGDPLGYIAQQLDKGTKNGNIAKDQARALAQQLDLVNQGYLHSTDFGDGQQFTGKGEMQIDPSVMVSIGDEPSMSRLGKDIEVDLQRNRSGVKLNRDTSINCSKAGKVSLGFFENIMMKTPFGAQLYVDALWKSILDAVVKQGHRPPLITRVSLYGGNLFINKKLCLLNHILGGKENIRLVDIVNFKELFRKFPRIKELRLDEEMLRAVMAEFGEYGIEKIFQFGKSLQVVYLKTLSGKNRVIKRESIQSGFIPEEAYNASVANEMDLRCQNILQNRKTATQRASEHQSLWGQKVAATSDTNEARKYRQRTNRGGFMPTLRKGGALLGAAVGGVLFSFGRILDFASGNR